MTKRIAATAFVVQLGSVPAWAQRTPDGHPDFQGFWTNGTELFYFVDDSLISPTKMFAVDVRATPTLTLGLHTNCSREISSAASISAGRGPFRRGDRSLTPASP